MTIKLAALLLGILTGLLFKRQLRPLLLERWRVLPLLPLPFVAAFLPWLLAIFEPDLIWTEDRRLLISLIAFRYLLGLLLILLNCLPLRPLPGQPGGKPPTRWYHRAALLVVAAGLVAEVSVLLFNQGYMPISADYLQSIEDPAVAAGIRNQALYLKKLISPETALPWLGQIWHWPLLVNWHLSVFPYISPAEVLTSVGLFLTGASQFFDRKNLTRS